MEEVGFHKTTKGIHTEVSAPGIWKFRISMKGTWTLDTVRDTLSRDKVLLFYGVQSVSDAVLLAIGWDNAMTDLLSFSRCKPQAMADALGRKHPAAKLIAFLRGEKQ